jgi:hypothetical protein
VLTLGLLLFLQNRRDSAEATRWAWSVHYISTPELLKNAAPGPSSNFLFCSWKASLPLLGTSGLMTGGLAGSPPVNCVRVSGNTGLLHIVRCRPCTVLMTFWRSASSAFIWSICGAMNCLAMRCPFSGFGVHGPGSMWICINPISSGA